ncbi:MAG: hypothetical protein ACHQYQ_11045, partial [Bacteriovoracales bacterium]
YAFISGKKEGTLDYIKVSGLTASAETYCDGVKLGSASLAEITSGLSTLTMGYLNAVPPKRCVTRFSFKEANTSMRLNQVQNACFEVGTQVDERAESASNVF